MIRGTVTRRAALAGGISLAAAGPALAQQAEIFLKAADGRAVRVFIWPATAPLRGTILFSHGALSSPLKYEKLLGPWSRNGFHILAPLHVDSTDYPDHAKYDMIGSWRARLQDMQALATYAGPGAAIAAGHSYGALVALTLGGAEAVIPPGISGPLRDPRIRTVVAFSPPPPSPGLITADGYATLATPALIETGSLDIPFGEAHGDWHEHFTAYDRAAPGGKYALALAGANHYFGGLICNLGYAGPPEPAQLAAAVRISTDFLLAFGAGDQAARQKLDAAITNSGPVQLANK
jgi:pimeloyl-ACP methyl ester carboxylesterase